MAFILTPAPVSLTTPASIEDIQDASGVAFTDTAEIDFSYNDGANQVTADLKVTTVVAGSYTNASLTVDSKGRLTAASSGTINGFAYLGAGNTSVYGGTNSVLTFTGLHNTIVGVQAGNALTIGENNTALGYRALKTVTAASFNTAIGDVALEIHVTGDLNTAVGTFALASHTSGGSNTAIGSNALGSNGVGEENTVIGVAAMLANTGSRNTAVGYESLRQNAGSDNVALGYNAGRNFLGSDAFFVGNVEQASSADDQAYSLMHGTFSGTAGSLTGQKLRINGQLQAASGTSALPAISFASNTALGWSNESSSPDVLRLDMPTGVITYRWYMNGVRKMSLYDNGIGGKNFDVVGDFTLGNGTSENNTYDIGFIGYFGQFSRPRNIYVGTSVRNANGTAGAPSYTFENSTTTGMFRGASGEIAFSIASTQMGRWTDVLAGSGEQLQIGSDNTNPANIGASGPVLRLFCGSNASGGRISLQDRVGSTLFIAKDTGNSSLRNFTMDDATNAIPLVFRWASDGGTGNDIGLAASGRPDKVFVKTQMQLGDGSDSAPSYSFGGDTLVGMFRPNSDELKFGGTSVGGVGVMSFAFDSGATRVVQIRKDLTRGDALTVTGILRHTADNTWDYGYRLDGVFQRPKDVYVANSVVVGTATAASASEVAHFSATAKGVVFPILTAAPATPVNGMVAYNGAGDPLGTGAHKLSVYANGAWVALH